VLLTLWAVDHEKVRETIHSHAEVGDDTIFPLLVEVQAISTFDSHRAQPASHCVVACADSDYIEIAVLSILCDNACLRELTDWRIDNVDVLFVAAFIVVLLQTRPFGRYVVRRLLWGEDISLHRIRDSCTGLVSPEIVKLSVGFGIDNVV
jgi:hypothetical protein